MSFELNTCLDSLVHVHMQMTTPIGHTMSLFNWNAHCTGCTHAFDWRPSIYISM